MLTVPLDQPDVALVQRIAFGISDDAPLPAATATLGTTIDPAVALDAINCPVVNDVAGPDVKVEPVAAAPPVEPDATKHGPAGQFTCGVIVM